jgi:hypothetical protein
MVVSKFDYALEVLTEVPELGLTVAAGVDRYTLVNVPATDIALAAAAPVVTTSNDVRIPAAVDIAVAAPVPSVGSGIGSFVSAPAAAITIAAAAPTTTTNGTLADPDFASVSLLLHMNGSNGSTTFTDSSSSALTVTANGNAQISTAQSKFGGASGLFDGNGDALTAPNTGGAFSFSSNTYTFEAWIYPVALTGFNIISSVSASAVAFFGIIYIAHNGSSLAWGTRHNTGSGITSVDTSGGTLAINTWQHIALSVNAGSAMAFINGTQVGSGVTFTAPAFTPVGVGVGNNANLFSADESFNGYIDDFRITKGVARYTANFTPPTAAFPDS